MQVLKDDVCKAVCGEVNYGKTAEMLGYSSIQAVYNWPKKIGITQLKSIILRMRAARIEVPEKWLGEKKAKKSN